MKMLEVVGNLTDTMCKVLGERATLGAAKKLADEMMRAEIMRAEAAGEELKFFSVDVDDGRFHVLYSVSPATLTVTPRNVRRQLQPAE